MELRHIRYFRAVAELLNFSRAAEQLRVAQPALSRQIRDLEEELGTRLLDRNRVRVQLTDAGRVFYSHACKVLAEVDMAAAAAHEAACGDSGELVVCHDWRIPNQLLAETIVEFRTKYPRVEVTLLDLPMHEQLAALHARRAHLGFVVRRDVGAHEKLDSLLILRNELKLAVNRDHRFARRQTVRIGELADETWAWVDEKQAPGFRSHVTQICRLSGFTPKFGKKANTLGGMLALISTGYGVCVLPELLATHHNRLVRFLRTDCPPLEIYAAWHQQEDSALLRKYLDILRAHVAAALPPA